MRMHFLLCFAPMIFGGPGFASPIRIVAAENFYGGVATQIAGNSAEVTSLLSNPNQDPHEFTASPSTAKAVADADIVIYSGLGYDAWMEKLLGTVGTMGKPDRVVIEAARLVDAKEGDNPHIWYDPRTMAALSDKLAVELARRNPSRRDEYQGRLSDFTNEEKPVLEKIKEMARRYAGTTVTATEPVFGYMAGALGFKMLNYDFQVGVMNDTEPSAVQTAAFEQSLRTKAVRLLFYNSQVTYPTTERIKEIARDSGVPIIGVTETQPVTAGSYAEWMLRELNAVDAALAPTAPAR